MRKISDLPARHFYLAVIYLASEVSYVGYKVRPPRDEFEAAIVLGNSILCLIVATYFIWKLTRD